MSSKEGKIIKELSLDHKASDEFEQKRIIDNNGRIYQYCPGYSELNFGTQIQMPRYSTKARTEIL